MLFLIRYFFWIEKLNLLVIGFIDFFFSFLVYNLLEIDLIIFFVLLVFVVI